MNQLAPQLSDKRVFLIATASADRAKFFSSVINKHITNAQIFLSTEGLDAMFKASNMPPHVFITDLDLPKRNGIELTEIILGSERYNHTTVIIAAVLPDTQHFVDHVVTGRVQFLTDANNEARLNTSLAKSLNFLSGGDSHQYHLHFLTPEQILFTEGDEAKSVYIVRTGRLQATKGPVSARTVLGTIQVGEFVGEMAHINNEPRSATVTALTDCELIEIPRDSLDMVLFSKPAWAKALIATLSKRLRVTNEALSQEESDHRKV